MADNLVPFLRMDLEKHIHVRIEKVNEAKGNATNQYPESDDNQACCFVRSCCVMPVARKKNIQDDYLTTVEGLGKGLIHENILDDLKKECQCKGKIVGKGELDKTIQLEGDRKRRVTNFLVREGLSKPELIKD